MDHPEHPEEAPLGFLLGRASRSMALRVDRAFHDEGFPIRLEHWIVLHNLAEGNIRNQRSLIDMLGRDKTAVTRLLSQMEDQGWVERRTDPDDRRSKRLSITVKGRTLKEKAEPVLQRVNRQVEEELPPGRLSETKTLLEELYQNLKDESEQGPPKVYFKDSE